MICVLPKSSGPPTVAEEIKSFCFKVVPGNTFGLVLYTIRLMRGTLAPELRRTISVALAIGWAAVALTAALLFATAPAEMTATGQATFVLVFSSVVMILANILVYNRVNYGFYL